jgi:signal transduction histidine kinase
VREIVARLLVVMALLLAFGVDNVSAQDQPDLTPAFLFESADFVLDASRTPPGPDAAWRKVTLPDDWYVSRPGVTGVGWYHMSFDLPPGPYPVHSFYLPRGSARFAWFYLNGRLTTTTGVQGDSRALNWDEPMRFAVSPTLLRAGQNDIYVRVSAVADLRQGLARVSFGPARLVLPPYFRRWAMQVDSLRIFGGAAFLGGMLALAFCYRIRGDRVMFWFGITALAWTLIAIPWFGPRFGDTGILAEIVVFPTRFAYAAPLLVACLRLGGKRAPVAEATLWIFTLGGAVLMPFVIEEARAWIITFWSTIYLIPLVGLLIWLIATRERERTATFWLLIAATTAAVFLNVHDYGRWMGWFDYDNPTLAHFDVPFVLVAIGVTIVDHQVGAIDALARANIVLEARIAEKTREIEANFQRVREAEHERALSVERRRIMADMHDGVGGSLLGVLSMIRMRVPWPRIERRVHEAMLELRLAIDSLEPVDGDLGVVLGNVRHRMRETIEASGVHLAWQVGEVPTVDYLTPKAILAIQRIVMEALTNALRHARAATITVRTDVDASGRSLRILVRDDGAGFDPATVRRGRGLDSVTARARGLGAMVEITSDGSSGTCVSLTLPLSPEGSSASTFPFEVHPDETAGLANAERSA